MPPSPDLLALARAAAAAYHELDSALSASSVVCTGTALVCAIVEQESAWNTHAIRYEPGFRTRYVAPLHLPPTEEIARSISWGLMQVMGQVAREHGFDGKFLSALCDPALGLDIGCAVLASKLVAAAPQQSGQGIASTENEIARALQLWNGGSNPNYAAQVLARLPHYQ
jgi:soluble lytic murein transglycosylase-like protein